MHIDAFAKMTLQDYPGKVASIGFTSGCQLRCPFCHNASLVTRTSGQSLETEFLEFLESRIGKLDGVVLTGGEPLLQIDIIEFVRKIKRMGFSIKLDTNGMIPVRLSMVLDYVDYVALDYKNHGNKISKTVGMPLANEVYFDSWQRSLELVRLSGLPYELRTTVVRELHSPDDLLEMARFINEGATESEKWYLQNFVKNGAIVNDDTKLMPDLTAYTDSELDGFVVALQAGYTGVIAKR